ncbi:hypothetical protein EVAR_55312_1 [Eumeta japonica]|uniref:Uncharacterized protein n=1 Tax=Eumeta variegata TaxID=151549 RepID=A0A4C1Z9R6_EUMVA|nr:hypothetical protein EVAR_55312_1 [Eumeta japonica]
MTGELAKSSFLSVGPVSQLGQLKVVIDVIVDVTHIRDRRLKCFPRHRMSVYYTKVENSIVNLLAVRITFGTLIDAAGTKVESWGKMGIGSKIVRYKNEEVQFVSRQAKTRAES